MTKLEIPNISMTLPTNAASTSVLPSAAPTPTFSDSSERLVVTLSGKDKRTAASEIISAAASAQAKLIDVRQTVVHGRLTLVLELVTLSEPSPIYRCLLSAARRLNLSIDFDPVSKEVPNVSRVHYVITLLSRESVTSAFLAKMANLLGKRAFATEKIARLSRSELKSVELVVSVGVQMSSGEVGDVRSELYALGKEGGVDVAFQAESVLRRSKRLIVFDMDSTLIQQEVIDELARYAGVFEQVKEITHRAMGGKLDFNQSLSERVNLLKGTPASVFDDVIENLQYTPGAKDLCRTLKKLGYRLAVISGGFTRVTNHVRNELGLDYDYANQLEEINGVFTGRTVGAVVNAQRKADLLMTIAQQERICLDQVIAIGDGANDLPMLGTAGLGIAFNAKPAVQEAADFRINQASLMSVLYLLGFSERDQDELSGHGGNLYGAMKSVDSNGKH